jgi:hypothetical protein
VTRVVFVAPYVMEATSRFLAAVTAVPDAEVVVVTSDPLDRFPEPIRRGLAGHWHIEDCLDVGQLTSGVAQLQERLGDVDVLTGILENLQVPLAHVRERLDIPGMDVATADRFRDKELMKSAFDAAGIPCARHARVDSPEAARSIVADWQVQLVVKPLAGMGAKSTFRLDGAEAVERWLTHNPPSEGAPVVLEEFLSGEEFSFESVLVDGELVWHSIGRYHPTPLTVLENDWIQWCVVLPSSVDSDDFDPIRSVGAAAVRALGLETGLSHMEWFRRPDGSIAVSEVGARPPGAQIVSLMSWAHDADMYASWAQLAVDGTFVPPERQWAVGAAYLRAQGSGRRIASVTGIDRVSARTHELVVESRLPSPGGASSDSYEGDGFVIVRSESTDEVDAALLEIVSTIKVETA